MIVLRMGSRDAEFDRLYPDQPNPSIMEHIKYMFGGPVLLMVSVFMMRGIWHFVGYGLWSYKKSDPECSGYEIELTF